MSLSDFFNSLISASVCTNGISLASCPSSSSYTEPASANVFISSDLASALYLST